MQERKHLGMGIVAMAVVLWMSSHAGAAAGTYDIRDYGAVPDGKTLNTAAIQKAIDACTRDGGGTVLVPGGVFLTGTFEMKDNVTLHLAASGTILGSPRREDYQRGHNIPSGNGNVVLISAAGARNFTIEGPGTIDGQGQNFYTGRGDGMGPGVPGQPRQTQTANVDRPHLMVFSRCENFRVQNIFLTRSAYHTMRILNCQYVRLDGIRIYCRVIQNNDGFHFNSSKYVNISNCSIRCIDDACALFGNNQYFTIANCSFSTRWSVFRFGSSDHIAVSNCLIYETYGCPIKFGGGNNSNMTFSNLIMRDVTGPICLNQGGSRSRGGRGKSGATPDSNTPSDRPPEGIRNVSFSNIEVTVVDAPRPYDDFRDPNGTPIIPGIRPGERRTCITVNAYNGGVIENIRFSDIHVTYPGGGTAEEGAMRDVPQAGGEYFGIGPRPAYGFYARGVKGLTLANIRFDVATPDLRPAVIFDGVKDGTVNHLSVQGNKDAESVLRFHDSKDVLMTGVRVLTPSAVFLRVEGAGNANIRIDGGDLSKAAKPLDFAAGADEKVVTLRQ